MIINRRQFIIGSGVILGAPAIVRAESLMKIFTPSDYLIGETYTIGFNAVENRTWVAGSKAFKYGPDQYSLVTLGGDVRHAPMRKVMFLDAGYDPGNSKIRMGETERYMQGLDDMSMPSHSWYSPNNLRELGDPFSTMARPKVRWDGWEGNYTSITTRTAKRSPSMNNVGLFLTK